MNAKLLKFLMFASKTTFLFILIQAVFIQVMTANELKGQALDEVGIVLDLQGTTLVEVLKEIEKNTDFRFTYTARVARDKTKLGIVKATNVKKVLEQLLLQQLNNTRVL